MPEQMRPHEVARQLHEMPYEIVDGRVESARLGELIRRSERVWLDGTHEANEHGHLTIDATRKSTEGRAYRPTTGLVVTFHDPHGRTTELGGVRYVDDDRQKATATVRISPAEEQPLLPEDYRWDAVVGSLDRAISQAWQDNRFVSYD